MEFPWKHYYLVILELHVFHVPSEMELKCKTSEIKLNCNHYNASVGVVWLLFSSLHRNGRQ